MTTQATRSTVPGRYRKGGAWAERFAAPMFRLAGPGARMTGEELDDLVGGLQRRDEPADALVRAVREEHAVAMGQVRAALAGDADAQPGRHPARRECLHTV